jgi:DNA-binding CsgD family transcriptional regulator
MPLQSAVLPPPFPVSAPPSVEPVIELLVRTVLAGEMEPATRDLLRVAAGGDRSVLEAVVLAGLGSGDLALADGRWTWTRRCATQDAPLASRIECRADAMSHQQRGALAMVANGWVGVHAAVSGNTFGNRPVAPAAADLNLTRREQQILVLLSEGLTAQAIGRRLGLSPRTVAKYQQRLYRKFGTSDRLTTVLRAQRFGLLPPAG